MGAMKDRSKTSAPPNKHRERTEATLRELLDAAERIFVRDGFERAQLETIAAETGRTRGAVYAHFKSKQDLFLALLERRARTRMDEVKEEVQRAKSQRERKQIVRKAFVGAMLDPDWALLLLEFKLFALRNRESQARLRALKEMLSQEKNSLFSGSAKIGGRQRAALDLSFAVLRGIPSALVLESKFDPALASVEKTRALLAAIFDAVMPEE